MAQQFFAILTAVGEAKDANAKALGIPMTFTEMALGDGNGNVPVPDRTRTALINQVRRAPLNSLMRDPVNTNQIIAEQVIPENVGGWWIRELGLYDQDGDLVAIANCPPTYKPQLVEGSGRTQVVRIVLIMSSADSVQLRVDPAVVLATRKYADEAIIASMAAHLLATDPHPQYTTGGEVLQAIAGAQATEAANGTAKVATQAEVNAAADQDDTKFVTAKKLWGWVKQATEAVLGMAKIATQAQTDAGVDDTTIVTPKKLRNGFAASLGWNGYIKLPSWMGGAIIQWGSFTVTTAGTGGSWLTFPMAFPTTVRALTALDGGNGCYSFGVNNFSATGATLYCRNVGNFTTGSCYWIAIGN